MPSVAVKVKWLKNKYDVEINLDEPAELFKTQVHCWGRSPLSWAHAVKLMHGCLICAGIALQIHAS